MTTHMTASRDKWLEARRDLLAAEKDLTRRSDKVAQLRRQLPWVRVDREYVFVGPDGRQTLADLFDGRHQLLVQHFMQHYQMVSNSVLTWRQYANWNNRDAIPEEVKQGVTT